MFTPFVKEILHQEPFIKNEVQFNLFHRISEGELDIGLTTANQNLIAMNNSGRSLWLWMNESLEPEVIQTMIHTLSSQLKDKKLPGIAGAPDISKSFAEQYSHLLGITHQLSMGMESYHCPVIKKPKNVPGRMNLAQIHFRDIVAQYCAGFSLDGYGYQVTVESQIPAAEWLINSGNLYLWLVNDMVVSMANIAHCSPRHGRINTVYTPPEERKKGYASALVAELCGLIMQKGLTPILFTDVKNPDSNKIYQNIGFIECGNIDEYHFIYE